MKKKTMTAVAVKICDGFMRGYIAVSYAVKKSMERTRVNSGKLEVAGYTLKNYVSNKEAE